MSDEPVRTRHEIQQRYPKEIRFCALCGGAMDIRTVMPDRRRLKVCVRCGFVDFPAPKLVAGALVVEGGRLLLLRRGIPPSLGLWTFPGGYVEMGETPAQAAARETREEVGIEVTVGRVLGVYADPADPIAAVVVYLGMPSAGRPSTSEEATEVAWFAGEAIPWNELAFATTRAALEDWRAQHG